MAAVTNDGQRKKTSCTCYPDFAVICLFVQKFGEQLGLYKLDISRLQVAFESEEDEVSDYLKDLHVYLLRRLKKNVNPERWERSLSQFCLSYSYLDSWDLDQSGYKNICLSTKLSILKNLLESQFDGNIKFKERVAAEIPEEDLRLQCYGRDKSGLCYWLMEDEHLTTHIYRVEQDDTDGSSWQIVVKERDDLPVLIQSLQNNTPLPCLADQSRSDTPVSFVSAVNGTTEKETADSRPSTADPEKDTADSRPSTADPEKDTADSRPSTADPEKDTADSRPSTTDPEKDTADSRPSTTDPEKDTADSRPSTTDPEKDTADSRPSTTDLENETADSRPNTADPEKNTTLEQDATALIQNTEDAKTASASQNSVISNDSQKLEPTVKTEPDEDQGAEIKGEYPEVKKESEEMECAPDVTAKAEPDLKSSELKPVSMETDGKTPEPETKEENAVSQNMPFKCYEEGQTENPEHVHQNGNEDSDSEDNIPISKLINSWKLLSQARKALEKAKKAHEKKKLKAKKKKKSSKKQKSAQKDQIDSPQPGRRSSRQRKMILPEIDHLENSEGSLDSEDEYVPQGRNARRQARRAGNLTTFLQEELSSEVENDDTPCSQCGKYTQPHLILLCDKCDAGWHTACIRPPIFYIPNDDWFCPTCEHAMLIEKLQRHLIDLDEKIKVSEAKKKRLERQEKYALSHGIHPDNIIVADNHADIRKASRERKERKLDEYEYDSWEESNYNTYTKRTCRKRNKISYRFDDYDELIDSAIKDDTKTDVSGKTEQPPERPKKPVSRGKDISNLVGTASSSDEDEPNSSSRKRKKARRLNDLEGSDVDYDDDDYALSDEGGEEDDDDFIQPTDEESDDAWQPASRHSTRSTRASKRSRRRSPDNPYDFINDDEDDYESRRSARRNTRTSAAAAQAALRDRQRFGFTSSEEEAASTPESSSESEAEGRIKNKWNSLKTYGGKDKGKDKKKKKRSVIQYNSDQSTEGSNGSEDEYIPKSVRDKSPEASDNSKEAEDESDSGIKRVNNRLESSSESEEDQPNNQSNEKSNCSDKDEKEAFSDTPTKMDAAYDKVIAQENYTDSGSQQPNVTTDANEKVLKNKDSNLSENDVSKKVDSTAVSSLTKGKPLEGSADSKALKTSKVNKKSSKADQKAKAKQAANSALPHMGTVPVVSQNPSAMSQVHVPLQEPTRGQVQPPYGNQPPQYSTPYSSSYQQPNYNQYNQYNSSMQSPVMAATHASAPLPPSQPPPSYGYFQQGQFSHSNYTQGMAGNMNNTSWQQPLVHQSPQYMQSSVQRPMQRPLQQTVQQPIQRPAPQPMQRPVQQTVQRPGQQPIQRPTQQSIQQTVQQSVQRPVQQPMQQPAQQTVQQPIQPPPHHLPQPESRVAQQPGYQPMVPGANPGFLMDNILQGETNSPNDVSDSQKMDFNEEDEMSSYLTMASFVTGGMNEKGS